MLFVGFNADLCSALKGIVLRSLVFMWVSFYCLDFRV